MTAPSVAEATRELISAGALFEMEERDVGGRRIRYWKNFPRTLDEVVRFALKHADKTYLVYEDERLNYAQTFERVAALSTYLLELGVARGDRIAIAMRNYPEWVMAFW